MIKFWSYKQELKKYNKKIKSQINKSLNSGQIFFGKELSKFEKNFTKKYKSKFGVAVGSGTDALLISLMALGIKPDDEIITTCFTFVSTAEVIVQIGAKPVFIDIDPNNCNFNM